jgi:hypothetical protein
VSAKTNINLSQAIEAMSTKMIGNSKKNQSNMSKGTRISRISHMSIRNMGTMPEEMLGKPEKSNTKSVRL